MKIFVKKTTSILLILAIMFTTLVTVNPNVSKATRDDSGDYYYDINSDGTITISGYYGTYKNNIVVPSTLDGKQVTGIGYRAFASMGLTGGITVSEGITTIDKYAFEDNPALSGTVSLPSTLTTLEPSFLRDSVGEISSIDNIVVAEGNKYFSSQDGILYNKDKTKLVKCPVGKALADFTIPETVTVIGDQAFAYCKNLTGKIKFPSNIQTIESEAFYECSELTGPLEFPESLTTIGNRAFMWCYNITGTLTLPTNLEELGSEAFRTCRGLTGELVIPNKITNIKENAFESTSFTSLKLPENLVSIGDSAFRFCRELKVELKLPKTLKEIGRWTFESCGFIGDLVIPEGVTTIGEDAFKDCEGFNGKLVLPNTLKEIEPETFSGCRNITGDLIIPEGVTTIKENAFLNCYGIQGAVIVPSSVTTIEKQGLRLGAVEKVIFLGDIPNTITTQDLPSGTSFVPGPVMVKVKVYGKTGEIAEELKEKYETIEFDGITTKTNYVLNGNAAKETVEISENLKEIITINSLEIENTDIAQVENKVITPVKNGTTNLIVKLNYNNMQAGEVKIPVTVTNVDEKEPEPIEIPITRVSLDKTQITLIEGQTQALTATIEPSNTTQSKELTWESSKQSVATVNNVGLVKAVSAGTTYITVTTSNGKKATCIVTVEEPEPEEIEITSVKLNKTEITLEAGQTEKLIATIEPENTTQSKNIIWESYDKKVAIVDLEGNVTAVTPGETTIEAKTSNGKITTCKVIVNAQKEIPITGITLNKTQIQLEEGATQKLTATVTPSNTTQDKRVKWFTENPEVATVTDGIITAKSEGTTLITASTTNGKTAICVVKVVKKEIPITSVVLDKSSMELEVGDKEIITATVRPEYTTQSKEITWESSNTSVATVVNGVVTAKSEGKSTITAKAENGVTASIVVIVTEPEPDPEPEPEEIPITGVSLNKTNITLEKGKTETLQATVEPSNTTQSKDIKWSTNNSSVATVVEGVVITVGPGTAEITATTVNGKTATCKVTVTEPKPEEIPITGVTLDKTNITLEKGKTETLKVTVEPNNTTQSKDIKWSTNNSSVATVSQSGVVTAVAKGEALITATASNGMQTSCRVTVTEPQTDPDPEPEPEPEPSTEPGVVYSGHIQDYGWEEEWLQEWKQDGETSGLVGKGKKVEAFHIKLTNTSENAHIQYRTHVQDLGWEENWVQDGAQTGTTGKNKKVEAIQIKLKGLDGYSVEYRSYVTGQGWLDWVSDGVISGTTGQNLKLEAVQIRIVKTDEKVPVRPGVTYRGHVQDIGWQDYVTSGKTSGVEGKGKKVEAFNIRLTNVDENAHIKYETHVQDLGWESEKGQGIKADGAQTGTTGKNKKVEAIRIKLENMPNYSVEYRAYVAGKGWQEWVRDWEEAGTTGQNLKLEAVQIRIVPKSQSASKPGLIYKGHIQELGWEEEWTQEGETSGLVGEGLKVEAFNIKLTNTNSNAHIKYETHVQDYGWERDWKEEPPQDGEETGTTGKNKKVEAIRIWLEGLDGYSVEYRSYVTGKGWLDWVSDGVTSGTTGQNLKLEAVQIRIVPTENKVPVIPGVTYRGHVQDIGWQEYVKDGATSGIEGKGKKVEAFNIRLTNVDENAHIKYETHVQDLGWEGEKGQGIKQDGAQTGTTGKNKKVEAIRIWLEGLDGYSVEYRAYVAGMGWQPWVKDGQDAGTTGQNLKLEAIQVRIVKK